MARRSNGERKHVAAADRRSCSDVSGCGQQRGNVDQISLLCLKKLQRWRLWRPAGVVEIVRTVSASLKLICRAVDESSALGLISECLQGMSR